MLVLIFSYYVAFVGNASQQLQTTFVIGNGSSTSDGTTTFTNPPPVIGDDYYVFIRLYSSIDVSRSICREGAKLHLELC